MHFTTYIQHVSSVSVGTFKRNFEKEEASCSTHTYTHALSASWGPLSAHSSMLRHAFFLFFFKGLKAFYGVVWCVISGNRPSSSCGVVLIFKTPKWPSRWPTRWSCCFRLWFEINDGLLQGFIIDACRVHASRCSKQEWNLWRTYLR